jgi:hypothetical protein
MITTHNYFEKIKNVNIVTLPEALQKGNEFVTKITVGNAGWTAYQTSDTIKKSVDIYLQKLNEHLDKNGSAKAITKVPSAKNNFTAIKPATAPKTIKAVKQEAPKPNFNLVERTPEELKILKRFINLNGKAKTKDEVLRFINTIQKAILEKRVRKTSAYAKQVSHVQDKLVSMFNTMRSKIKIEINEKTLVEFSRLVGSEKVFPSIQLLKKYINLNGKVGTREKAAQLMAQMQKAVKQRKVLKDDTYATVLNQAFENIAEFVKDKKQKSLQIVQRELNGLEGVLGCHCNSLNGFDAKPTIMNSMDFANVEFNTIGLTGKWLNLIGDPSSNFTAMVFGKPKMGKSYLCIDFAGYLARQHGKVLYVAKEEGLDMTLQMKLNDKDVAHPNLDVASILPADLSGYDFIFLDSVNKLGLTPDDLNKIKAKNQSKSFVFIFQTTKQGNFRGENSFQHDVDVVIEVPERGKAVQMGRFNQGGEMRIF